MDSTYDDCELIRKIYNGYNFDILSVNYSVGKTKRGSEIIFYGPNVKREQ
jgi:hypothetical protein